MDEQQQLHDKLEQLHAELGKNQPADPDSRAVLDPLQKDVHNLLQSPAGDRTAQYHSLRGRLNAALEHLEDSHPQLTLAIGQVLDNLAAIGI